MRCSRLLNLAWNAAVPLSCELPLQSMDARWRESPSIVHGSKKIFKVVNPSEPSKGALVDSSGAPSGQRASLDNHEKSQRDFLFFRAGTIIIFNEFKINRVS